MNRAGQLFRLQQLDQELQQNQEELGDVEKRLGDNEALVAIQSKVVSEKEQLENARKSQKNAEWELEDLQEKIRQIDGRLYSGKTRDPKELVNLEKEIKGLKSQVKAKEDALLVRMSQVEELETRTKAAAEEAARFKREWEQRQTTFRPRKSELEMTLARVRQDREAFVQQIDSEAFNIYERIRRTGGQAVAKVERGRCLGCHITVPTSQWQKAKAGDLVQCNNCSRILYLE